MTAAATAATTTTTTPPPPPPPPALRVPAPPPRFSTAASPRLTLRARYRAHTDIQGAMPMLLIHDLLATKQNSKPKQSAAHCASERRLLVQIPHTVNALAKKQGNGKARPLPTTPPPERSRRREAQLGEGKQRKLDAGPDRGACSMSFPLIHTCMLPYLIDVRSQAVHTDI